MSEKKSISSFRPKIKNKLTSLKPNGLTPFHQNKIIIQQTRKAQTPTRKIALSPSILRGKSKTPVDNKNNIKNNIKLTRPTITSRSNGKNQNTVLNHSQSITLKRKKEYNIFNVLQQKFQSSWDKNNFSDQQDGGQMKTDEKGKYIHVNMKSPKSSIGKKNTQINEKSKLTKSLPFHKKSPSTNLTISNSFSKSISLKESRNYNYSSRSLLKKLEDNQKLKERLLTNTRSPSAKTIFGNSHHPTESSINGHHTVDKIRIKKRILSPTLPSSPTYVENKLNNNCVNRRNTILQKPKSKKDFKELNTSPLIRHKPETNSYNIKTKTHPNLKKKSKSPILKKQILEGTIKKQVATNNSGSGKKSAQKNITVSVAQSFQNPIKINKTLREYPNHVNLVTNSQINTITINTNPNINNKNDEVKPERKNIKDSANYTNIKKISQIDSLSQKGFAGQGVKKENQDRCFIYYDLNKEENSVFMGVCDGHGLYGHDVSQFLSVVLPKELDSIFQSRNLSNISDCDRDDLYSAIIDTFLKVNSNIILSETLDTTFSGSTCSSLIVTQKKVICANAGDSRCIVGKLSKHGEWYSHSLSRDHKPNDPDESKRIISSGGKIEAYKDQNGNYIGPERVWVMGEDVPGLAMSRAFGDDVAQSVGVIALPEIMEMDLLEEDKFLIAASDGIWEFISSDECVSIVKDFYLSKDISGALKCLYKEASKRWIMEEEVIDDITVILVFFE